MNEDEEETKTAKMAEHGGRGVSRVVFTCESSRKILRACYQSFLRAAAQVTLYAHASRSLLAEGRKNVWRVLLYEVKEEDGEVGVMKRRRGIVGNRIHLFLF